MHILLGLVLILFAAAASGGVSFTPSGVRCLDVISAQECNTDATLALSEDCRDADVFGDGVYAFRTDPGLSQSPASILSLRVGSQKVSACEQVGAEGVVCVLPPDLAGVFRLFVVETGTVLSFAECKKNFFIDLPLSPRQDSAEE